MDELGLRLAQSARRAGVIYLQGELGAGKTTLVRSLLRGFGYQGRVRSPTYTLLESYPLEGLNVYHLDLYRLASPEELEWIGLRDLLAGNDLLLIEWPEQGRGMLPPADLVIAIEYKDRGRQLCVQALSACGKKLAQALVDTDSIINR
jgi:tRNA threonylcarbamoyladenosine biosynthesis protein TsaE